MHLSINVFHWEGNLLYILNTKRKITVQQKNIHTELYFIILLREKRRFLKIAAVKQLLRQRKSYKNDQFYHGFYKPTPNDPANCHILFGWDV
ncbi:hypothetical protein QTP88_026206 [Uroleucon formosanum]